MCYPIAITYQPSDIVFIFCYRVNQYHKDVVDNAEGRLKDSLPVVNNVNKEFVYSRYDNEMNLNVKNIDNGSKNMQYNHENESKQIVINDREIDMSKSSKSNQLLHVASPLQQSTPITPLCTLSNSTQSTVSNFFVSSSFV